MHAVEKYAKVMYDAEEVSHLPALLAARLQTRHVHCVVKIPEIQIIIVYMCKIVSNA